MASLGHVAVGLAGGRLDGGAKTKFKMCILAAVALLPDADVIAFALGIPYGAPFGHRGASHSLAAAAVVGGIIGLLLPRGRRGRLVTVLVTVAILASHGMLDALTDGGRGVALLWPWSPARIFAPLRPIPVAPIGARLLSTRGLSVMAWEVVAFSPFWLYAVWPWRRRQLP